MTKELVSSYLSDITLGRKSELGSLSHLSYVASKNGLTTTRGSVKADIIESLSTFYCTPNRLEHLWFSMNDAERKIGSIHFWADGSEPTDCAEEVAKEFNIPVKQDYSHFYYRQNGLTKYKRIYAKDESPLWLLFPKEHFHFAFHTELYRIIGDMKRNYSMISDDLAIKTRENRTTDFANIIRFANTNKMVITKTGLLSKSSAMKLLKSCGYEEFTSELNKTPEDVRTVQELCVTYPLSVLCSTGGLLAISENNFIPSVKAVNFLKLSHEQLVKTLFDAYLKNKRFDEISMMTGIKSKRGHHPYEARLNLIDELKYCPIGQLVYTYEFERYLRIDNSLFARTDEKLVVETGNNYYSYPVLWEHYEKPLIYIILSFFGALGIIDIAWGTYTGLYDNAEARIPIAFKINALGAYVLGLSDTYTAPVESNTQNNGGFTVLPDYTIIIPESADRLKHELFFERFFTKESSTNETTIYKLDFSTIARAIDSGTNINKIRKYLSASDKPIPENIVRALNDWEKQSGRIKLRKVTILECDDPTLLEEVIRYSGMGKFVEEKVQAAVVVDGNATKEIKKVIEKNKRFCNDVI